MHSFGAKEWADKCEQLDATIADLQGQLKEMTESQKRCWNEWTLAEQNVESLQQRVAQLEQERDAFESHAIDLQADHARVLGLLAQVTEIADMMLKGTECEHDVGLCSCEHRRIVKQAQRSLPAQPAQGARCDQCGTRLAHEDHKYDCPYMIVKRQHAEGETRA